jgi:hypothetical protein
MHQQLLRVLWLNLNALDQGGLTSELDKEEHTDVEANSPDTELNMRAQTTRNGTNRLLDCL